jgi:hypothetical protein
MDWSNFKMPIRSNFKMPIIEQKKHVVIKIDMECFSPIELSKQFHPFHIYGPTCIRYEYKPIKRKIGYISIYCYLEDISSVKDSPWFICLEDSLPEDE